MYKRNDLTEKLSEQEELINSFGKQIESLSQELKNLQKNSKLLVKDRE